MLFLSLSVVVLCVFQGVLENSLVFYSFYTRGGSLDLDCLNTPLLFLLGMISVLLLSIIMVVRRSDHLPWAIRPTFLLQYNLQIEISAETCICCSWLLSGAITIDWINSIMSNCLSVCKCCEQLLNWEHSYWQHTCTCVSHFNCCERIPQRDTVMEKTWDTRKDYISMLLHSLAKL